MELSMVFRGQIQLRRLWPTGKACIGILTLPCLAIDASWGDLSLDCFPYTTAVFWWLRRFSEISVNFRHSIGIALKFNRNSIGMLGRSIALRFSLYSHGFLKSRRFYNIPMVYRKSIEILFEFNRSRKEILSKFYRTQIFRLQPRFVVPLRRFSELSISYRSSFYLKYLNSIEMQRLERDLSY